MRPLSDAEESALAKRREEFDAFIEGTMEDLSEFADSLGLSNPHMIIVDPVAYIEPIGQFIRDQVIESEDVTWLTMCIGFFIGEVLNQRLGGCWHINEWPDTRYFLRFVVGRFRGGTGGSTMVDPIEAAAAFVAAPPGRDLERLINEVTDECQHQMERH